jgi:PKHD-type hydroxylase
MLKIPDLLAREEIGTLLHALEARDWHQGENPDPEYRKKVKRTLELRHGRDPAADSHLEFLRDRLMSHEALMTMLVPKSIIIPQIIKYAGGGTYGRHSDAHFMGKPPIRTDVSMTLFLTDPSDYEGGVLTLEYTSGEVCEIKEPAGTLVCYPSGVLHYVSPVTKGERIVAVSWLQSWIREPARREVVSVVMQIARGIKAQAGLESLEYIRAINVYTNLMRMWCES